MSKNKLAFIQEGKSKLDKHYVVCSIGLVDEETFKNLIVLENLRIANLNKIKSIQVNEEAIAKGITSFVIQTFKVSGNEYFIHDSLKEIINKFIKNENQIKGDSNEM